MFERDPRKIALRTDPVCMSAIQYGLMAALATIFVVASAGALTPRLHTTFSRIAVATDTSALVAKPASNAPTR